MFLHIWDWSTIQGNGICVGGGVNEEPKFSDIDRIDKVNWPPQWSLSTIDDVWILFEEGLALESRLPSTVKPPSSVQYSRGTGKRPLNGGWPINRGSSYLAEHNYNLKQKLLFIWSQTRYAVVTFYLGLYFSSSYSWNKAKLSVSSAWWPLNKGDNNNIALVRMAKKWPRQLIEVANFIEV